MLCVRVSLLVCPCRSFSAYIAIFVSFVLSLEKGKYMNQFAAYAWAHMVLLTTFIPSSLIVANLFEGGIIWFLLPSILIMINDTMAYVFGRLMGRTPLIKVTDGAAGLGSCHQC